MAWYLVFWRNRATATVVPAASANQARSRAQRKQKGAMGRSWPPAEPIPRTASSFAVASGCAVAGMAAALSSAVLAPKPGPGGSGVPTAPGCSSRLQAPAVVRRTGDRPYPRHPPAEWALRLEKRAQRAVVPLAAAGLPVACFAVSCQSSPPDPSGAESNQSTDGKTGSSRTRR
jgi:hypothetical protein